MQQVTLMSLAVFGKYYFSSLKNRPNLSPCCMRFVLKQQTHKVWIGFFRVTLRVFPYSLPRLIVKPNQSSRLPRSFLTSKHWFQLSRRQKYYKYSRLASISLIFFNFFSDSAFASTKVIEVITPAIGVSRDNQISQNFSKILPAFHILFYKIQYIHIIGRKSAS